MIQSWLGKNKSEHLKAPADYQQARLVYADELLDRVKKNYYQEDIDRLMAIYMPFIEGAKRVLEHRCGPSRRTDIEDVVHAEFMHMTQMYSGVKLRHFKFPNFLKHYFGGWCYRHMQQLMSSRKNGPRFLNSTHFDTEQNKESEVSSHIDMLPVDALGSDSESVVIAKDSIKSAIERVRRHVGEEAADAFLLFYLYKYNQVELSDLFGCTQAQISHILREAKDCFVQAIHSEV